MTEGIEIFPQDSLRSSLGDAVAWANSSDATFRNEAFLKGRRDPDARCVLPFCDTYHGNTFADTISTYRSIGQAVEATIADRHQQLKAPNAGKIRLLGGKLIVLEPEWGPWDGLSEFNSIGFFDTYDVPPPNCWVGYVINTERIMRRVKNPKEPMGMEREHYLISYVPAKWIKLAAEGIRVNVTNCINWCDDAYIQPRPALQDFFEQLRL